MQHYLMTFNRSLLLSSALFTSVSPKLLQVPSPVVVFFSWVSCSVSMAFVQSFFLLMMYEDALTSFSELPSQMLGRSVLYRQNEYRFYRPAAFVSPALKTLQI